MTSIYTQLHVFKICKHSSTSSLMTLYIAIIFYVSVLSSIAFLFPSITSTFSLTEAPPLSLSHLTIASYHPFPSHPCTSYLPFHSHTHSQISFLSPAASVTAPQTGQCPVSMADVRQTQLSVLSTVFLLREGYNYITLSYIPIYNCTQTCEFIYKDHMSCALQICHIPCGLSTSVCGIL